MKNKKIGKFILENVKNHPNNIVALTMKEYSITRTTVLRHIRYLISDKSLYKTGTTRNICYLIPSDDENKYKFTVNNKLDEYTIWNKYLDSQFDRYSDNVKDIFNYAMTEMINNVRDHSNSTSLEISLSKKQSIFVEIKDNGIGIFEKISKALNIDDKKEVLLHLSKGKLTTDPTNHTGEGIFFTSRAVDKFSISANGIKYLKDNINNDWTVLSNNNKDKGTTITLELDTKSNRNLVKLFKSFQDPETLAFNRTEFTVELSKLGNETYISRSQAKRVLLGLEKFDIITLDFSNVRLVGQGFADEVFRVYQNKHTDKQIKFINTNEDVKFMLTRALTTY